ncbi:MAG: cysteine desulfurase family protein [Erysipelotrichaceae bacterium]|nr:cysteine desulfurase family protein [Erysipelotrichaceae bacterium]
MKAYFDTVSTTRCDRQVLETYKKLLDNYYCNSDALYDDGVAIYEMQEKARGNIASSLGVRKDEVIFTSGASEASSLAIKGLCFKHPERKHLITTSYEHSSVHHAMLQLRDVFGYEVSFLGPNEKGVVSAEMVRKALRPDTLLVSIMNVNNELGTINDINAIKKIVKKAPGVYFHSDITQALGKIDVDLSDIDMASFSAHKIHGLKGSGALIKKRFVELEPIISGGQQEMGIRGGTSNALVNIVLAKTLRLALENQRKYEKVLDEMHEMLIKGLKDIEGIRINSPEASLKTLLNISTPLTSEVMLNALNAKGIMVSSKSTCGSRTAEKNRALSSLGIDDDYAIRISFDYLNNKEEIAYLLDCLKEIISKYG